MSCRVPVCVGGGGGGRAHARSHSSRLPPPSPMCLVFWDQQMPLSCLRTLPYHPFLTPFVSLSLLLFLFVSLSHPTAPVHRPVPLSLVSSPSSLPSPLCPSLTLPLLFSSFLGSSRRCVKTQSSTGVHVPLTYLHTLRDSSPPHLTLYLRNPSIRKGRKKKKWRGVVRRSRTTGDGDALLPPPHIHRKRSTIWGEVKRAPLLSSLMVALRTLSPWVVVFHLSCSRRDQQLTSSLAFPHPLFLRFLAIHR